ncbi:Anthranilate synthase component 1 [compost metagenome]
MVSHVQGMLADGMEPFDALTSCFPAGTLSGSPKIRAMEIIAELEGQTRGFYGGAVGYFSFGGNLDSCIVIRTIVFKDGKAYIQAGGGIVADSVPDDEYEESRNKAGAMIHALSLAEKMMSIEEMRMHV